VKYSVFLNRSPGGKRRVNGNNFRGYVWVDGENFNKVRRGLLKANDDSVKVTVSCTSEYRNISVSGDKLEISALDEEGANEIARDYGLPEPFLERDGGYVLNVSGE